MRVSKFVGAFALVFNVHAQNAVYCPSGGVCFAVNIPESTAKSGNGDMFFQISGPSTLSWIGLGQGDRMDGANIFIVYTNSAGTNVTLSPRIGVGDKEPATDSMANVTLLSGSGVSNGLMTANVRCSNCNSWSGGSMSFTDSSSSWIWSYKSGSPVASDSIDTNLAMHTNYGSTTFNLQNAAGGNSADPFVIVSTTSDSSPDSSGDGGDGGDGGDEATPPSNFNSILMTHAILSPIAFVILFPLGAISIRLFSFKGLVWIHAGWMVFAYLIALGSTGLGVWIAVATHQLDTYHAIIGLIVIGCLLLQPVTGLAHHLLYKRSGRSNMATYPHILWGRAVITLGIINGGLGLKLADNTTRGELAYLVVAGVMWLLWMVVILVAFVKSRRIPRIPEGEKTKCFFCSEAEKKENTEKMRQSESGQDSPVRQSYSTAEDRPMVEPGTAL